ncbi:MAG: 3-deoxy-7-phosphoheptulonate synthase [Syntrophomonadaceae bacterium]|nr:3-deoxy-7-phosphoheptulonate synthase [Syntrophomonadaceae bacterium]
MRGLYIYLKSLGGVINGVLLAENKIESMSSTGAGNCVSIGPLRIGKDAPLAVIAGPCAIENEEMLRETAWLVVESGARMIRGGAFKPRTSPYSFQGLGLPGLKMLHRVGQELGVPVISEVMDSGDVEVMAEYVDVFQVGARNMQNYPLLRKLGTIDKPVVLKRGLAATIEEWLLAAEYIMVGGNKKVILCERGIRTHERWTRNTLDLSAVAVVKSRSNLPVIVDPSHATGHTHLVAPMAKAAVAAGADGLMIEVHPCPEKAMSDGQQSLTPAQFREMMLEVSRVAAAVGRPTV